MTETVLPRCGDCNVNSGEPHVDGCDVSLCTVCGWQRISCDHGDEDVGWGQVWTGTWPGVIEINEGLASDLNDLALRAARGLVRWDGQRWRPAVKAEHSDA